jgi:hypothetical protein
MSDVGAPAKLEHAYLVLFEPGNALDHPGAKLGQIDFQFNPKELTLAKSATWSRSTTKGSKTSGPPQYNGPDPSKMTIEMFFDASRAQDTSVTDAVAQLFSACVPTANSLTQNKGSAPWVLFRWGTLTGFQAYIKSVSAKYTLFTAAGQPIRATCTVDLEEIAGEPPKQNPTSGGLLPRRVHTLRAGDSLAGIAYREYGNAARWRELAEVNGIDDPMRLRPGSAIFLPTIDELSRSDSRDAARAEVSRAAG